MTFGWSSVLLLCSFFDKENLNQCWVNHAELVIKFFFMIRENIGYFFVLEKEKEENLVPSFFPPIYPGSIN